MQHGHLLEQIIANFNSHFFMNDFVFLNPKYLRDGNEKELCDLLLILNDECIVVSVKGTDGKYKSDSKLQNWLVKKTWEGSKQAKGGINWLKKVSFTGRNLWNEDRKFEPSSLRAICGLTLLECSQHPFDPIEYEIRQPKSDVPLHVLSINDFLNVVVWLGSIRDVFDYFSKRADVSHSFTGINQERPLLAYYTLRSKDVNGFLEEDKEELSAMHQLHLMENLDRYKERDRLAGYVNAIVRELHTRHPSIESYMPSEFMTHVEPLEKRSAYLQMAAMLNALPISNKVYLGQEIESLLKDLRHSGQAGCFPFKPLLREFVFLFAFFSNLSRTQRIHNLHSMLPAALYCYNVTEGLGVAFDADNSDSGFDLMWVRDRKTFDENDRKLSEFLFPGPEQKLVADLFGQTRPYLPK